MRPLRLVLMVGLFWGVVCGYGSELVHLTVGHPGCHRSASVTPP